MIVAFKSINYIILKNDMRNELNVITEKSTDGNKTIKLIKVIKIASTIRAKDDVKKSIISINISKTHQNKLITLSQYFVNDLKHEFDMIVYIDICVLFW